MIIGDTMKKTKIVTTIGPASKDKIILEEMILNGMDVVRLNMKYSSLDFCKEVIENLREVDDKLKTNTSILMDLEGPNITTGYFINGEVSLKVNDQIKIFMEEVLGDNTGFSVSYNNLINDVKTNSLLKINNGNVELRVLEKYNNYILCNTIKEGTIKNESNVNVIDTDLNIPYITLKDKENIKFACDNKIDYLALSLVKTSEDVLMVNDLLIEYNNDHLQIISKIEKEKALENIDDIIKVSDGVMIDGDYLETEIPKERVLSITKSIINKCHLQAKISIAMSEIESNNTEIDSSKIDVMPYVLDGVDAIVLTKETTIGKYPVGTVTMMKKILETSELNTNYVDFINRAIRTEKQDITGAIASSVVDSSLRIETRAIVIPTISGYTPKKISRYRTSCSIIALTPNVSVARSLGIYYGVVPIIIEDVKSFDLMIRLAKDIVLKRFNFKAGDKIIITGGYPFKEVKYTNFMKIEEL